MKMPMLMTFIITQVIGNIIINNDNTVPPDSIYSKPYRYPIYDKQNWTVRKP